MSDRNSEQGFLIIGIGASAGGVQALEAFFGSLPDRPNAAFVVIQHLSPDHPSQMSEILQRQTPLAVREIAGDMDIAPDTIYVLPPRYNVRLENGQLRSSERTEGINYPIDIFFKSLANNWDRQIIGILLSGTGSDGTEGLKAISRAGGIALVQSPETAQFTSMPSSAIPSGLVDEILSPEQLSDAVFDLVNFRNSYIASGKGEDTPVVDPDRLQHILDILADREDIDFSHYKISTISRRILHRCALTQSNLDAYIRLLHRSEDEQRNLRQDLLIGATCFFRDRPAWDILEQHVIPSVVDRVESHQQLRVWIPACATGEEAYSMAILLDEAIARTDKTIQIKIFATDLDGQSLETAARGVYPENIANQVSPERLDRYFSYNGGRFQVKRRLREMLIVAPHDLTKNAGFSKMHLVSCRNVLIYMQPQLQQRVVRLLHFSLAPKGILFLGSSETLGEIAEEFTTLDAKWKLFQKRHDNQLSVYPISRQTIVAPLTSSRRTKSRRQQFDRIIEEVFQSCFEARLMTCVLVNSDNQLLRVFYNNANLLEFAVGETVLDITEVVRLPLKLPLTTALHRAKRNRESVTYTGIKLDGGEGEKNVSLRVSYGNGNLIAAGYLVVVFEIEQQPAPSQVALRFEVNEEAAQQITELEYELQQTRENLQVTIEELETTNEEQQATNEELLASNEELQSTNEELQSVNEELYTVNAEHQSKIQELTRLNNDIDNLLRSTDLGVIFLDRNLNIRSFTPAATHAINIRKTDIGRPLEHFTHNLNCSDLVNILQGVVETENPIEREFTLTTTREQLLARVNPYIREDGSTDGIVLTFVNISELKRIQQQFKQTNTLLETIYDASPIGLCLHDREGQYVRVNQTLADINGLSIEEHLGKRPSDILPEIGERIESIVRRVLDTGTPERNVEIEGTTPATPDCQRYWIASFYPVDLDSDRRVAVAVTEVTDLKQVQQELQESRNFISRIAESSPSIIYIYNLQQQRTTYLNQPMAEMLGGEDRDLERRIENSLDALVHPEDGEKITEYFQAFAAVGDDSPLDSECRMRHKDESWRWFYVRGIVFRRDENNQPIEILCVGTDISDRKQIEERLTYQNQQLARAIAEARSADSSNRAKSEFLANVSHEIRTPMNAVMGMSQLLLRDSTLGDRQRQLVSTLYRSSRTLLSLVDDILDLSRLEAGELRLKSRPFNVLGLVRSVVELFESQAQEKNVELRSSVDENLPETVIGADDRLQQILINLIGNALKFTDRGSVAVAVKLGCYKENEETRSTDETPVRITFTVTDTGIGIAPENLSKLFRPFGQLDTTSSRRYGGTGLGLAISKRLVELMNGEIGIESQLGEGSTFWFTLPLQPHDGLLSTETTPDRPSEEDLSARKTFKILVAEDLPDNRQLILLMLEEIGYKADWVSNGQQALDRAAAKEYDIILMDCQMPILDGYKATKQLRDREGDDRHTTVIGLTANAMAGDRQKCLDAGMDDYISKPISLETLEQTLSRWLD